PRWRGGDQRNGERNQYGLSSGGHVRVLRFDGDHIILSTVCASSDRKEQLFKFSRPPRRSFAGLRCVPVATLPDVPTRMRKTISDAGRECSTICVMDQCHASARWCHSISANSSQKSPSVKAARAQLPQPCHHQT